MKVISPFTLVLFFSIAPGALGAALGQKKRNLKTGMEAPDGKTGPSKADDSDDIDIYPTCTPGGTGPSCSPGDNAISSESTAAPLLQSVSRIQFDDESKHLFVSDWKQSKVFAFELPDISENPPAAGSPYSLNIKDLAAKTGLDNIVMEDIRVRPNTYDAYAALTVGPDDNPSPVIAVFRVDEACLELQGGSYTILPLSEMPHTSADINDIPSGDVLWFEPEPIEMETVNDMQYHKNKLYATGISNLDSASVIRIYDFPFTGSYKTVSLETYNVSHQQWEKRAPIRHFQIHEVDLEQWSEDGKRLGKKKTECIVAALLCTPLAYIPLDEVHAADEKEMIRTRAIAEIGDGGTPLGFFKYSSQGYGADEVSEKVMIVQMYRNSKIIPWETIVDSMNASKDGIMCGKGGEPWVFDGFENGDLAGMGFGIIGAYRAMAYMPDLSGAGQNRFVGLRRDIKKGKPEIVSSPALLDGVRLSDMAVEEYWWDSYVPAPNAFNKATLAAQEQAFEFEGYPDSVPPEVTVTEPNPCTYELSSSA